MEIVSSKTIIYIFGALLLVASIVNAIKCYDCNSHDPKQASCKDQAPDKNLIVDCSEKKDGAKFNLCRTIKQWIDFPVETLKAEFRVIRKCGSNQTNERPCYYKAGFGGRQEVCTCHKSECNHATQSHGQTSMTILVIVTVATCIRHFLW